MTNPNMNEVAEFMKLMSEEYGVNLVVMPAAGLDFRVVQYANVVVVSNNGKAKITKNRWGNIDP